jgi:translation initiation factor 2B subunit (eIF-2B alpha/beta/delta family)
MTDQTISAAFSHSRSAQWFHELTSSQQESYRANVKEYKRKEKLIVKISQKMLKIDEAIRVFARSYILFEMMSILIRKILQLLIIRYKKIDDQIKKTIAREISSIEAIVIQKSNRNLSSWLRKSQKSHFDFRH